MKQNQAWGWLVAAVMAAGLNASYHNGDLQWLHRVAEQAKHRTAAVLALASGRADLFLMQAQILAAHEQADSGLAAMTPVQAEAAISEAFAGHTEASAACKELRQARIEILRARTQARLDANAARIQIVQATLNRAFDPIPAAFNPINTPACPRVRVIVPRIPGVRIPAIKLSVDPV